MEDVLYFIPYIDESVRNPNLSQYSITMCKIYPTWATHDNLLHSYNQPSIDQIYQDIHMYALCQVT